MPLKWAVCPQRQVLQGSLSQKFRLYLKQRECSEKHNDITAANTATACVSMRDGANVILLRPRRVAAKGRTRPTVGPLCYPRLFPGTQSIEEALVVFAPFTAFALH